MSKTISSILSLAALIPGPQQPFVAAAAIAVSVATALTQKSPRPDSVQYAIKTERPPRESAYGRVKKYGAQILYETNSGGYAVDVWAFHDGRIDAIEGWYLGDKKVTRIAGNYVSKVNGQYGDNAIMIDANLGAATETAWAPVIAKLPGIWTENHRGDGVVTGFMISKPVKAKDYQEVYPDGGPNASPLGLLMRAQPVFDWRDPGQSVSDPLSWKWSENWVLHLAHYDLVRQSVGPTRPPSHPDYWSDIAALYSYRWSRRIAPTLAYWTAAANDADVEMPLRDGGTEPRYRSCVSHKHTDEHKTVIASLLACGDGWMVPREDGALVIYSGRYYSPTVTVGPDEVVIYSVEDGVEDENALNQINVTYISDQHDYNQVDTDPWTDEDDILARGALRADELNNQVPSFSQARRLAKRKMSQAMAKKRGTLTTTSAGSVLLSERYINLRLIEGEGTDDGYVAYVGPAEITSLTRNLQTGAVSASWIQADPNIDAWNPATEEGYGAAVGDRVAREPLDGPTITSVTPTYGQNTAYNTPGVKLTVIVAGPDRSDLTWFLRTRPVGGVSWLEQQYPDIDPGPSVTLETDFLPLGELEVEAAYQVGDGRLSPWGSQGTVDTGNVLPSAVTNLSVSANEDSTLIAADWDDSQYATRYLVEVIVEA